MNITIYINAKKLNPNDAAAIAEYTKRLSAYCKPSVHRKAIPEAGFSEFYHKLKASEHTRAYHLLPGTASLSSEAFAETIHMQSIQGTSHFLFFIGYTVPKEEASVLPLSLSSMTMSYGLCGVVLCEQLYRCFRIMNHQPYHK